MKAYFLPILTFAFFHNAAVAQPESVSAGASYSTGNYGGADAVEVRTAWVGTSATISGWRVDATLPYLQIDTGTSAVDAGGVVLPGVGARVSGLGDATVRFASPSVDAKLFEVTVAAQVKAPTGQRIISTGKFDAGVDIEFSRQIGALAPFLSVGYRTYGDSDDLELSDGWLASMGSSWNIGSTTLVASYDWSQSAVGGRAAQELTGIATGVVSRRLSWLLFGTKGLSTGAADLSVGAGLVLSFGTGARESARRIPR